MDRFLRVLFSEGAGLPVVLLVLTLALTIYFALRDRYERQQVLIDTAGAEVTGATATGCVVKLPLLNKGNSATVVRDIRLVDRDGREILSYRKQRKGCSPELPFRLDAPDERIVTLDVADGEESALARIDVELIGNVEPIRWPYVLLRGTATMRSSASGNLTVTPAQPPPPGPPPPSPGSRPPPASDKR